jgi:hypothetical protein
MAIEYKVLSFPTFGISKQLFHVPGLAFDGGFTSGGARITSPEPGGFSFLEIQPALQLGERAHPLSSWLMSQTNGQILRVRLAKTPQLVDLRATVSVPWNNDQPWNNLANWDGEITAQYSVASLEGSGVVKIDMSAIGELLQPGHVIGHKDVSYKIDEIEYDGSGVATISLKPPLRSNVVIGDAVYFRPWFTGQIINPGDFRTTYDADQAGNIQLGKILMSEVIL